MTCEVPEGMGANESVEDISLAWETAMPASGIPLGGGLIQKELPDGDKAVDGKRL